MITETFIASIIAFFGVFAIFIGLMVFGLSLLVIAAKWKIFKKAGKAGWEAIIPFYSTWILVEISGLKWWFFLIICGSTLCSYIPFIGLVALTATFFCNYNLAIKFGKDPVGYGIGLTLVPIVFYPILAFGDNKFVNRKVSSYGPIPEDKVDAAAASAKTTKDNVHFCKNCGAEVNDEKYCSKCGTQLH